MQCEPNGECRLAVADTYRRRAVRGDITPVQHGVAEYERYVIKSKEVGMENSKLDNAVNSLRHNLNNFCINDLCIIETRNKLLESNGQSLEYLIGASVDQSTLRSYTKTRKYTPSSLYRTWALNSFSCGGVLHVALINCKKNNRFDYLHNKSVCSLEEYWKSHDDSSLSYAQLRKLVDLLFKHLAIWSKLEFDTRKWIWDSAYVPLDKYSLKCISEIANEKKPSIVKNKPTMGDTNKKNYVCIQNIIRDACGDDFKPLDYELLAWNLSTGKNFGETPSCKKIREKEQLASSGLETHFSKLSKKWQKKLIKLRKLIDEFGGTIEEDNEKLKECKEHLSNMGVDQAQNP